MLYKPSAGIFKDNCVFFHDDRYYLFSMYSAISGNHNDRKGYNHVWQAVSHDGVHWEDVGPVITAPFTIFAMGVWQVQGKFYLNHGSFTTPGRQNVLRLWESDDLTRWTYLGAGADLFPDARWYDPNSRLDCMDVIPVQEQGHTTYYGVASGPGGWLHSTDGVHWQGLPAPPFEWGRLRPAGEYPFEIAGWQQLDGTFYLLGSRSAYAGNYGYCVYTLTGDSPRGPFRPDAAAYRLSGNSHRSVHLWARPCRADDQLLASSYLYDGYGYRMGAVWLPPLKRFVVDDDGHLRLAYWEANEALKGNSVDFNLDQFVQLYPAPGTSRAGGARGSVDIEASATRLKVAVGPECSSINHEDAPLAIMTSGDGIPLEHGLVLEATVTLTCVDKVSCSPGFGIFLEESPQQGAAILMEACGIIQIGHLVFVESPVFVPEDVVGTGCAAPQLELDRTCNLRLLLRRNMFELYLDDRYVQTFNTSRVRGTIGTTPRSIGFIVQNGQAVVERFKLWRMTLD